MRRSKFIRIGFCLTLCFLMLFSGGCDLLADQSGSASSSALQGDSAGGMLRVEYLDAGQADAIFITLPGGRNMLIDGGNNSDGGLLAAYLKQAGVSKIDFLVSTHPHEDHIGGLDIIVDRFKIGKIFLPKVNDKMTPTTKTYEDFLTAVKEGGYKLTATKAGDIILDEQNLKIECLAPGTDNYKSLNDYSVVLKITYGSTSFLFMGDAESVSEKEMLENAEALKADVLKVGHHGSHSSTGTDFLSAVSPEYAIICCGADNSYGHPHDETLSALTAAGITVNRTDTDGTVIITSNGSDLNLETDAGLSIDGSKK